MKIRNANKHNIEYRLGTWMLTVYIYFLPKWISMKTEDPVARWVYLIRTL